MIRNQKFFFLGLLVSISPFLGFPLWWKFALVLVLGVTCIALSVDWSRFDLSKIAHSSDLYAETHDTHVSTSQDVHPQYINVPHTAPSHVPTSASASVPTHIHTFATAEYPEPKRVVRPRKKKVSTEATGNTVSSIDF